jgi:hypothetical protein
LPDAQGGHSRNEIGSVDPLSLSVIDQAAFVLQCFEKETTAGGLVECLEGEASLAQAYILFFSQMGWIRKYGTEQWRLTDKGKEAMAFLKLPERKTLDEERRPTGRSPAKPDSII